MTRILIIDDEPSFIKVLAKILAKAGYQVTSAGSGMDALKLIKQADPFLFDLIITDAMMPEMSGYETALKIREEFNLKDLPILMLTHKRHRQDIKKAVEVGITDYILKPIDEKLLFQKIEELVSNKRT